MDPFWLALPGFLIWLCILFLPWRPWSTREHLESGNDTHRDLSQITVLIPARNEARVIESTLAALTRQGPGLRIILIDDQSSDGTAELAKRSGNASLGIFPGEDLPPGWSGKLWALQQGSERAGTEYLLLLDADIELLPGTIASLLDRMSSGPYQLVSLMAFLRMENVWERLLMPAFIFFFKLLYPFSLSNSDSQRIAAAAGGCILVRREALLSVGGFDSLRKALIDDCALARRFKNHGYRTWIGLTRSALSQRRYETLYTIVEMVSRTAFTQLHYSVLLLLLCTLMMLAAFVLPVASLLTGKALTVSVACLLLMCLCYIPTLTYYRLNPCWALTLPVTGLLYLLMTWNSACRHWWGTGSFWKGRSYSRQDH